MKEQHEEPEVLEESPSSGASGAADKEGRIKPDVTINLHKCSVFGFLQYLQRVSRCPKGG